MQICTITKTGTENWQRCKLLSVVFASFLFIQKVKVGYAIYLLPNQEPESLAHPSFLQQKEKKNQKASSVFSEISPLPHISVLRIKRRSCYLLPGEWWKSGMHLSPQLHLSGLSLHGKIHSQSLAALQRTPAGTGT